MTTSHLWCTSILILAASGCGRAGQAVRPDEASASEAVGEASAGRCKEGDRAGESNPLAIDLADTDRAMLEAATSSGVAVVRYTCDGLEVLRRCQVVGDYDYVSVSRKDTVVRMDDEAQLEANFSGPVTQVPVGAAAGVRGGRSLHLAYSVVGIESAAAFRVWRGQLEGNCDGATHYVFGLARGAFAMRTGSNTEVFSAAEVFDFAGASASAAASKDTATSDGRLEACSAATPSDTASVAGCQALIRVELAPIDDGDGPPNKGGASPVAARPDLRGCADGYVLSGDVCLAPSQVGAAGFLCSGRDFAECRTQCQAGSAGSCGRLGRIMTAPQRRGSGDWVHTLGRDYDDAVAQWTSLKTDASKKSEIASWLDPLSKACDEGEGAACSGAVVAAAHRELSGGAALSNEERLGFELRGCEAGDAQSCFGVVLMATSARTDDKLEQRAQLWGVVDRSCRSGSAASCLLAGYGLGGVYTNAGADKERFKPQGAASLAAFERGCNGGLWESCVAGLMLASNQPACVDLEVNNNVVQSELFPKQRLLSDLQPLCSVEADDDELASRLKSRACQLGAPISACR